MTIDSAPTDLDELEKHRHELTGYCYRMLGSGFEADDAVQETMVRAWKAASAFEGRSSVRSWLYRIATNVCIDMLRSSQRRAQAMELGPARAPELANLGPMLPENTWISPIADTRVVPMHGDPAEVAEAKETIRLAFITALQHLPARQRAMLILADVLRWPVSEVAELLDSTTAAVNSGLQRARATLAVAPSRDQPQPMDASQRELVDRYVDAFERYDMSTLVTLLREDAVQSMPPFPLWLQGATDIIKWQVGPGLECKGSRLVATNANGCPAFGQYRVDPNGGHAPWALIVLELDGDLISELHFFLDVGALFPTFGLAPHLPA